MRALLQRVSSAAVSVDGETVGAIGAGWLILLGIGHDDTEQTSTQMAEKVAYLRAFEDASGKTNLSLLDTGGAVLVVSQFTLYAETSRGRRPGFTSAAKPEHANPLVDHFAASLRAYGVQVEQGRFGAHMQVSLVNDGPFTLYLEA